MIYLTIISCLIGVVVCEDPMGHMEPLGSHRPSEGHVDILEEMPSPQEFWDKYCSIGKPAVLRGFSKNMPAYKKWTDEYIKNNYGDLMVKLESKYEKDFKPEGDLGMGQDSLKHFIDTYHTDDKYCVSQLPGPMSKEVLVPPCATCGSFRIRLLEANLWLSSGNTRSLLHRDADNAINCLLNGTKDWILIDPKHENLLPIAVEPGNPYGGFTLINVNKVNLKKYPKMKKVPWYYANMVPGDCLFLPKGHWHQVRSYGTKNMAVSMLLARLQAYENIDCPKTGLPDAELLSDLPMVWTYDGYGAQTMGNVDPFELNETLTETCNYNGKMTLKSWERELMGALDVEVDKHKGTVEVDPDAWESPEANKIIMKNRAIAIMRILDPVNGKLYDCKDRSILTVENLKKIADIQDPDPANTKEYEYLHFSSKMVEKMIVSSMVMDQDNLMKMYRSHEGSKAGVEWIVSVLDEDKNGKITTSEVQKNMDTVLNKYDENNMLKDVSKSPQDPANTKEYEYLHFGSKMVQNMIVSSMVMDQDNLMKMYRSHEGSKAGVEWIVSVLDEDKNGKITLSEIQKNMDTVLNKYDENNMLKDVSKSSQVKRSIIRDDEGMDDDEEEGPDDGEEEDGGRDDEGGMDDLPSELRDEL